MPKKYSKTVEDYLEAVYVLIHRKGYARTKDIAAELRVNPASVTEMLRKLHGLRLVSYERYAPVLLTREGERLAKAVKTRHDTLTRLFKMILVSDRTAEDDACRVEHELSPETIEQLTKFVDFAESASVSGRWLEYSKKR